MTDREKQIEKASEGLADKTGALSSWAVENFKAGARWADENPDFKGDDHYECKEKLNSKTATLLAQLDIALRCLNKIAIAQRGEMDYTADFFELVKMETKEAFEKIKELE